MSDSPEVIDNYEVPRERLYHIDGGVVRVEQARNARYGEPADRLTLEVERLQALQVAQLETETTDAQPVDTTLSLSEQARRLSLPSKDHKRDIYDQEAA